MLGNIWKKVTGLWAPAGEISYSRISAYQACPVKYRLIYEEGFRVPPNPFISLGISIHRTLEDFHRRRGGRIEELLESYDSSWKNEGFQSPQQAHDFYEKGRKMLARYFKESIVSKSEVQHVEKDFTFRLGRTCVHGIIDRIDRHPDGTREVIDYKTHAEIWKQDRVDSDLQLSMYALACERSLGFKPDVLSIYFLTHGVKIITTRGPAQLAAAMRTIEETARKIEKRAFTPNTSHCPRCDFRRTCRDSVAK